MTACPKCGAVETREIAPGFVECQGRDEDGKRCGSRYQPPSAPSLRRPQLCACGTYAIGQCVECDAPVCGDHSDLYEERRLCAQHFAIAQERGLQTFYDNQARAEEDRAQPSADQLSTFLSAANAAGTPGLKRFAPRPEGSSLFFKRYRRGWKLWNTARAGEKFQGALWLLPDGRMLRTGWHAEYVRTGHQQGHYDGSRVAKSRQRPLDPEIVPADSAAASLDPSSLAERFDEIATEHGFDWRSETPSGMSPPP